MCARAGVLADDLLSNNGAWVSHEQFESLLESLRERVDSDEAFVEACAYHIEEAYGPLRFLLWATSPGTIAELAARTLGVVSTVSRFEVVESRRSSLRLRYTTSRAESRLMCLSRQGASTRLPTFWGLPPAEVHEAKCVARGDTCCDYEFRWAERPRWFASAIGVGAGLAVSMALAAGHLVAPVTLLALPVMGALAGYALELRRAGRANLTLREEQGQASRLFAEAEAEARRELLALNSRQREWTRLLEESAVERQAAVRRVFDQLTRAQAEREVTVRGFTHDIRNPIAILKGNIDALRADRSGDAEGRAEVLVDVENAIDSMLRMLQELLNSTITQQVVTLVPTRIEVGPFLADLQHRLRALVYGKDIRVTVLRSREAPDSITTDPLLLNRLVDNLLTNAAKYTDRGSIVIEVDGAPKTMTIKISDTGRGMQPDALSRSFHPRGSDPFARTTDSFGVGLSVVVRLLEQVGGRLEVMSKPDHGTTFWLHLPQSSPLRLVSPLPPAEGTPEDRFKKLLNKVVSIRPTGGAK
jgi:signal transduction histidine kinase